MGRKCLDIKTLHGHTIKELIQIERTLTKDYSKSYIRTVIMRYQGIPPSIISKTIGKSPATVSNYIHRWNEHGLKACTDLRGGSTSTFTDKMLEDLINTVQYKDPRDYGFQKFHWNTRMLKQYIQNKYHKNYSTEWIRQLLIKSGFSYKKGKYLPCKSLSRKKKNTSNKTI